MKGFTRDKKFIPMTDYKKVRKSRDPEAKTQGVVIRKARESESMRCMMGGKHVRIDSPDKFDPYNACKKCGADIRLKDGKWVTTTYDEREHYNKNNSWERKARTVSLPKFHRVKEQEDGLVKFWAESSDGKTVSSLIQSKDFDNEMEIRISLPDFERINVRGSKDIMDDLTFEQFLDKTNMHLERQELMRKKREPFPVGERRPSELGDQDVIEAISGKKLTQTDLIAMQRATRKKGELSEEDFQRRQEIVRKLNDLKHKRDKIAVRKIDPSNSSQFNKKSRALGKANDKLNRQKEKFKKEFGVEVVDI